MRRLFNFAVCVIVCGSLVAQQKTQPHPSKRPSALEGTQGASIDYQRLMRDIAVGLIANNNSNAYDAIHPGEIQNVHVVKTDSLGRPEWIAADCSAQKSKCQVTLVIRHQLPACMTIVDPILYCGHLVDPAIVDEFSRGQYENTGGAELANDSAKLGGVTDPHSQPRLHKGLWEDTGTTGMKSGDYILFPRTSKSLFCIQNDKDLFSKISGNCIPSTKRTGQNTEEVVECKAGGVSIRMHLEYEYSSPEEYSYSGQSTTGTTGDGNAIPFSTQGKGRFLHTDCGSLKPGESREVK